MPPKQAPPHNMDLTREEQMLLMVAARVDTAIRHKEANPGEDYSHYESNLSEEAVRSMLRYFLSHLSNVLAEMYYDSVQ